MLRIVTLLLFLAAYSWAAERPNIIFLLADDQTFDSLGCYGNEDVKTPNIDQLSKDGLTFDHYYNTTAICMASRANILTGLYEYRNGCNFGKGDLSQELFAQSYPMLLRDAGYVTAFAGKIGIEVDGVGLPEDSFDWWGAGPGQTSFDTKRNKSMAKYAEAYPHATRSYGAFGSDFVKWAQEKDKPFCLSISFKAPHRPVQPDPEFDDVYAGKTFSKPANFGREAGAHFSEQSRQGRQFPRFEGWGYADNFDETLAKYHQLCYAIDVAVGMIREAVQESGAADNTVIIYTSDNGYFNGAHGLGSKVLPYEESTRAPMIIFDPRKPEVAGRRTSSLAGNIDVAPTILEMAGVEAPKELDGKSLVPLFENQKAKVHSSLALMNCWGPEAAQSFGLVTKSHKYIYWYFQNDEMQPAEELYDLGVDRLELKNVIDDDSEKTDRVRKLYDQQIEHLREHAKPKYEQYGTLFDRHSAWDEKQELLPKKLTPAGK
ncbi:MAG: sulfatase [Verrucomicrobiota bacterium]